MKVMRRQQNEVLGERIKVERARETYETERAELEQLEVERERTQKPPERRLLWERRERSKREETNPRGSRV